MRVFFIDEDKIVIKCKEDLINTYVKTDCEELVALYLEKCKEFGFAWFSGEKIAGNENYADGPFLGLNEDIRMSLGNGSEDYFDRCGCRKLTLSDLKPRTRTEYEKVTESIFDLREEFERGELYFKCSEGDWVQAVHESEVVHFLNNCCLYRKVEKQIDWREEVSTWVQQNQSVNIDFLTNSVMYYHGSVSNDTFLEMCRVALRANGELD